MKPNRRVMHLFTQDPPRRPSQDRHGTFVGVAPSKIFLDHWLHGDYQSEPL
jgi:hypothetical protein